VGQRREEAERGDDTDKKKGQNCDPIGGVAWMAVWNQQQQEGKADCECRNKKYSAPLLDWIHR